jgi:hypothetical protein
MMRSAMLISHSGVVVSKISAMCCIWKAVTRQRYTTHANCHPHSLQTYIDVVYKVT